MKRISHLLFAVAPALLLMTLSLPLRAEVRIDEKLSLAPGGKFILDSDAGSVELSGGSRTGAHILVTSEYDDLKEKFDFKFEEHPGEVRVIVKKKGDSGWLSGWFGTTHAPSFKIEVPARTDLQIKTGGGHLEISAIRGDADLRTSGGHIRVMDLEGKLAAETSGGHISLKDIVGDANVETSGGHIEVKSLKGALKSHTSGGHVDLRDVTGDIDTSTSGGHITIAGAGGRVQADTSGGSVEVAFAKGNARGGVIESSGGGITVQVDPSVGFAVDAETSGGHVDCSLPIGEESKHSRSTLRGTIGKGGESLRLRTSAGSISIEKL